MKLLWVIFFITIKINIFELSTTHFLVLSSIRTDSLPSLVASCNAVCGCEEASYSPVCGANGVSYFSPCHAGCPHVRHDKLLGKEVGLYVILLEIMQSHSLPHELNIYSLNKNNTNSFIWQFHNIFWVLSRYFPQSKFFWNDSFAKPLLIYNSGNTKNIIKKLYF